MEKIVIDENLLNAYMEIKELIYDLNLSREQFLQEIEAQTETGKKISGFFEQFGEEADDEMNSFVDFMFPIDDSFGPKN